VKHDADHDRRQDAISGQSDQFLSEPPTGADLDGWRVSA